MNILLIKESDGLIDLEETDKKVYIFEWGGVKHSKQLRELDKVLSEIKKYSIDTLVCSKKFVPIAARALWMSDLRNYVLADSDEAMIAEMQDMSIKARMWDTMAANANGNPIEQAGFVSSVTGERFTEDEMREWADNTEVKLSQYIGSDSNIMEIGIASGLTCMRVAPKCNQYVGVDISKITLMHTAERLRNYGISNVSLMEAEALEVDKLNIGEQDMVILNSVVQYFPGYNYFILVMEKIVTCMKEKGVIYIGDVPDLDKMDEQKEELKTLGMGENNKSDLYFPKEIFYELQAYIPMISAVEITDKTGTIENELNKYRYDVLLKIDKQEHIHKDKVKFQYAMQSKDFSWREMM